MLDKRTLDRINNRPRGRGSAAYAALGAVAAAVAAFFLVSYAVGGAVLLLGVALVFLVHKRDVESRTIKLVYDLDGEAAARFSAIRAACEALSGAKKVWRVEEKSVGSSAGGSLVGDEGLSSGASLRHAVEIGLLETPGVAANVEVWAIKTDAATLFFLPECVLSYAEDVYRAVSYDSLGVVYRPSRTVEDEEAPEDAEVIGETWRYVNADGSPDHRYSKNPRHPIVSYGLLSMTGMGTRGTHLLVSNKASAVRFARPFGAGRGEERAQKGGGTAREERARRNAEAEVEKARSLFKVLGVEPGATWEEISTAYKKKARIYHPDRAASLAPEVREMAELRMKEINAAYGELKRRNIR